MFTGWDKYSTSELSINLNGSEPVTVQDTGSAYMTVQQSKVPDIVSNTYSMWNKWRGPDTEFKLTCDERVQPISASTSTPIPQAHRPRTVASTADLAQSYQ